MFNFIIVFLIISSVIFSWSGLFLRIVFSAEGFASSLFNSRQSFNNTSCKFFRTLQSLRCINTFKRYNGIFGLCIFSSLFTNFIWANIIAVVAICFCKFIICFHLIKWNLYTFFAFNKFYLNIFTRHIYISNNSFAVWS